jgi:hypothetical protein
MGLVDGDRREDLGRAVTRELNVYESVDRMYP